MPYIGVVTVTYNSSEDLRSFLASLAGQHYHDFKLYAVDNHSSDESVEILAGMQSDLFTKIIRNESNCGVAAANNQGIRAALMDGCSYVLLLNNDTTFDSDFLTRLVRSGSRSAGPVTPRILAVRAAGTVWYDGGFISPWCAYKAIHERLDAPVDELPASRARAVDYAPTCSLLVPRSVFGKVGLMDESFFVYCDDVDFMLRLKQANVPVTLDPSITMLHRVGGSTGGMQSDFGIWWETRNTVILTRKHATSALQTLVGVAYLVLRALIRCARGQDTVSQGMLRIRAILAGLTASRNANRYEP